MRRIAIVAAVSIFTISACGQGFINLNFESAYSLPGNPPRPNGESVSVTNATPGWTAYGAGEPYLDIYYVSNYFSGAATDVELEGGSLALSGEFSVGLYQNGSISQTGSVPAEAASLQFEAEDPESNPGTLVPSDLNVTLGGQSLIYSLLSEGPDYSIYGANIPSSLDGQTEALAFACEGPGSGNVLLDNIEFSPMSVPEPGPYGLIGVGVVLYGFWHFRLTTKNAKPA
jgi:hypothetical protein